MEILISNRQKKTKFNLTRLRNIAEEILRFEEAPDHVELSIVLCDDDFIQKLNNDYLGRNRPTDVLSFPIEDDELDTGVRLLGDVVISIETAQRQAEKLKHSVGLEVAFLLVHGILHLMGYDHDVSAEQLRMRDREMGICRHLCDRKLLKGLEKLGQSTLIARAEGHSRTKSAAGTITRNGTPKAGGKPKSAGKKGGGRQLDG
ncbi:MAG TPA: rRNA maturation RNase YbeY [Candidatus Ozemobacteraceae bacterium]|nr:rRNA maturation RNase YbeY [Candidatus Ozemobacteraceae bacterium]